MSKHSKPNNLKTNPNFTFSLLDWFDQHGRKDLPWQQNISPYRVWVSEIMLQQTQVVTVIPYFKRFMAKFPTLQSLAAANLDDVLHLWTGLGYYARARNLHQAAIKICLEFEGKFPDNLEVLISLPGIGRSTAGAILAIAFEKATAILDGNVRQVLTRHYGITGHFSTKQVADQLWQLAEQHTPTQRCADYTQAIMDLGATLCTRSKPTCLSCPINDTCLAYRTNQVNDFPSPKKKTVLPTKSTRFLIFINEEKEILFEKRPPFGIWGGLWSFPECPLDMDLIRFSQRFNCQILQSSEGPLFKHTFSHFHLEITPIYLQVKQVSGVIDNTTRQWCQSQNLPNFGLAAPVKKLLNHL
jgi:A/G-specific adenine glycosylase